MCACLWLLSPAACDLKGSGSSSSATSETTAETARFFCLVDALADEVVEVCDAGWTESGA